LKESSLNKSFSLFLNRGLRPTPFPIRLAGLLKIFRNVQVNRAHLPNFD